MALTLVVTMVTVLAIPPSPLVSFFLAVICGFAIIYPVAEYGYGKGIRILSGDYYIMLVVSAMANHGDVLVVNDSGAKSVSRHVTKVLKRHGLTAEPNDGFEDSGWNMFSIAHSRFKYFVVIRARGISLYNRRKMLLADVDAEVRIAKTLGLVGWLVERLLLATTLDVRIADTTSAAE